MPQAPRYTKNERTLRRELARVTRRLHQSEDKNYAFLERSVEQLTEDRNQQTRRARQAEQAARRALVVLCEARADIHAEPHRLRQAEQDHAQSISVHQAVAGCIFAVFVRLLFL